MKQEYGVSDDRRDSVRVPCLLRVRESTQSTFDECRGNLALGGVYFSEAHPPYGSQVEIQFTIPGTETNVQAMGEILRVSHEDGSYGAHVKFRDLSLEVELAIARFLQGQ